MKKTTLAIGFFACLAFAQPTQAAKGPELTYQVNLNDRADDRFKVTLDVKGLKSDNNIFQFAATAPGTYQTMDIGRFVHNFKAFDKKGRELEVKQVSTNQWELSKPDKVRKITYQIAETWDTPVDKDKVYDMCGTSLESDHALINGQAVFGYLKGMQATPMRIKLEYPQEWTVGTALKTDKNGYYVAESYDHIVDSPILAGTLTKAETKFNNTTIDIYTYSKTGMIKSEDLLSNMTSMLEAANAFVVDFPVDRYTFLYHFEDQTWGAWEHSYSSEYIYKEAPLTPAYASQLTDVAAHEFFHVITPLNIHSEVIERFNFVTPTPSQHLWLYEGTTEWASDMMRLRSNMIDLPAYLQDMQSKLHYNDQMDKNYSLQKLSLTSYQPEGQKQYGNIYNRGAVTAALLDIRLLELSGGKRGLREVINELSKEFGPKKAFPENDFFELFTAKTYPEIGDFFNRYVKGTEALPLADYFGKLGINYSKSTQTGNLQPYFGYEFNVHDGKIIFVKVSEELQKMGLRDGDALVSLNGTDITFQNVQEEFEKLMAAKKGDVNTYQVLRNGSKAEVKTTVLEKEQELRHHFELDKQASPEQLALRANWLKNL
ncbi:peptidase [Pontibacter sp. SGAir0037]|uniref:M61 family metallopeptidase n=1 Tax=Pontibacter sp. SGAir0037 TaxID=2571030 RepID=UPI0010CD29C4|nr:peptidase [Pontibacter sp. SGAir0037]QCR21291.1 peptidase [Pontibacter sp. SGAir0037]